MFKIYDGREKFYQWDINRKLIIEDPSIVEVHFCNRTDNCSLVCETFEENGLTLVNVPNILLQTNWKIHVYAYDGEHTKHEECYEVVSRTKPADYVYEETAVKILVGANYYVDGVATGEVFNDYENNVATGYASHAEGYNTTAGEDYSHTEGYKTQALKKASHSEGYESIANGYVSHAEGWKTQTFGNASHAEGNTTEAIANTSHAEGSKTVAGGKGIRITGIRSDLGSVFQLESYEGIEVGDACTIVLNNHYHGKVSALPNFGVAVALDPKVKITETFDNTLHGSNSEKNTFRLDNKPDVGTVVLGKASHVEGEKNRTIGWASHAEGAENKALGANSHVEGSKVEAAGENAHAEGRKTKASGKHSHAQNYNTQAIGESSTAMGADTIAYNKASVAEGVQTKAGNPNVNSDVFNPAHAEGNQTQAIGYASHAEGQYNKAEGEASHAEGSSTIAKADYSHVEGIGAKTYDKASHAEGAGTTAGKKPTSGSGSTGGGSSEPETNPTEGIEGIWAAHAEGIETSALGKASHTEGRNTMAEGENSHAEGYLSNTTGFAAHAEGENTKAWGYATHAEGQDTLAVGIATHVEGVGTKATYNLQHVQGKWNVEGNYAHIVGNGSGEDEKDAHGKLVKQNRSNAHTLDWNGNAWFAGTVETTGFILTAPNGKRYKLTVTNTGGLTTTAI